MSGVMCVLDGSSTLEDWMVWDRHPVRRSYEVVMDLGALRCQPPLSAAAGHPGLGSQGRSSLVFTATVLRPAVLLIHEAHATLYMWTWRI